MKKYFAKQLSVLAFVALSLNSSAFAQNVDGSYMRTIRRLIQARWLPPRQRLAHYPVVIFQLNKKGEVSNIKLKEGSGNSAADSLALEAVQRTNYPPLTGQLQSAQLEMSFDFSSHRRFAGDPRLEQNLSRKKAQLDSRIYTLEKQLADCEKVFGTESVYPVPVMDELIAAYEDKSEYTKSEELASKALKIREEKLGSLEDDQAKLQIASSLAKLGNVYFQEKRFGDAIPLYDRSLRIYESVLPDCLQVQELEKEKAKALYVSGKRDESEALYGKLKQSISEEDKHIKAANLNNEASKAIIAKQFKQATAKLEEAMKIDADYKIGRANLVILYLDQGIEAWKKDDYKTAKSCYQAGVKAGEQLPLNKAFIKCSVGVAMIEAKLGNYEEANTIYEKAMPFFSLENDKVTEKAALEDYALVMRKLGRNTEALEIDQRAKAIDTGTKQSKKTK